jgi:hypothetical protein
MTTKELFNRLTATKIISTSSDKTKAVMEYSVTLSVAEYEELEKELRGK